MRIGIDSRFFGPTGKGIGRYTQELIANLEKSNQKDDYFIFLRKDNFDLYQPQNPHFHKVLADYPWYSWQEQVLFPKQLASQRLDLVHFLHFNVPLFYFGRFVVTIHDLTHNQTTPKASTHGKLTFYFKKIIYYLIIKNALYRAEKIITVSNFIKDSIVKQYKINPKKISVTYEAALASVEIPNSNPPAGGPNSYLLYVGNAYPHKNLERLIKAFKIVLSKHPEIHLILVGKMDYFYHNLKKLTQELGLEEKVIFPGQASDEKLAWLYKNGLAYVFPSLSEGFGLPGLEAMKFGLPVIASKHQPLPEIYGSAALYFNPKNIEEMAATMNQIIESKNLREELIQKGSEQIKKYSWEKCAQETEEIYKTL
ncbi:MAG: glycosyltransferase family 1 protein [Patescibacteria group bacterium]|nr:glycosyltransferase family 1 protein [Patescibacteria group bacterium]